MFTGYRHFGAWCAGSFFAPSTGSRTAAHETFWARWWSLVIIAAVVIPVTLFRPYKSHPPIYTDGIGHHLWTRAMLDGDLSFRRYAQHPEAILLPLVDAKRLVYQNKFPPGLALLRLPVMAFLVNRQVVSPLISSAEHGANLILGALALLGICLLCLRMCQLLALGRTASHQALLTTVFGTGLFHYGTYDACMSHIYSALLGTLLLWMGIRALVRGQAVLPALATAGACLFLVLIRNTNVLLLAGLTGAYLAGRKATATWQWLRIGRDLAAVLGGAGIGIALQLGYNYYANGRWVLSSYLGEPFLWHRPRQLAVLFSFERGLFTYYPIVAVALAAGLVVRRTRLWTGWFALVILAFTIMYGFWWCWTLGTSFGYRGLVEVLPAGAVLLAAALASLSGRARTAVSVCAWLCMFATLELMAGAWSWHLAGDSHMRGLYWQHLLGCRSILWFLY